mmetsp:Transcript_40194/g.65351  ORF Transcript_40194/g.65351 Transcript_40194/m.65351 type:complete len:444 (+) Transcript_40194:48-1379(+)
MPTPVLPHAPSLCYHHSEPRLCYLPLGYWWWPDWLVDVLAIPDLRARKKKKKLPDNEPFEDNSLSPRRPFSRFLEHRPDGMEEKSWEVVLEYCGIGVRQSIEFYSGIGGMAAALEASGARFEILKAFDLNIHANSVYEFNYRLKPCTRSIEHLRVRDLEGKARLWMLSPPCQPFTRAGNQKDIEDNRTKSFLHLLEILKVLETPPDFFIMENVKGFDTSLVREIMLKVLKSRGFNISEFMLQPKQFGIPNTRLRYYCVARRLSPFAAIEDCKGNTNGILTSIPSKSTRDHIPHPPPIPSLRDFLGDVLFVPRSRAELEPFLIPKRVLSRCQGYRFDVAGPWSCDTSCFTKAYGSKHVKGTGPVLLVDEWRNDYKRRDKKEQFRTVKDEEDIRFFTPEEALILHGFPANFRFPSHLTSRQAWACIGNSLNAKVVAALLEFAIFH